MVAPFANGIIKDKAAVSADISSNRSNGQTEGQITKLKLVKRQMYARYARLAPSSRDRRSMKLPVIKTASEPKFDAD